MHNLFQSCRLVQAVSFANGDPQFSDAERGPVQKQSLSFATANVVTAGSTVDCKGVSVSLGLAVSGRMAKLERVFHENGIHVIGILEGRASNDGRLTGAHYEILTAACEGTTKSLKCQLWIERSMTHAVSSVVAHSLRVLTVDLRLCSSDDTLRCNVVVCHVPCNKSAVEERVTVRLEVDPAR